MQAWREEVERAREGQRDAERKLSSVEVLEYFMIAIFLKKLKCALEFYANILDHQDITVPHFSFLEVWCPSN